MVARGDLPMRRAMRRASIACGFCDRNSASAFAASRARPPRPSASTSRSIVGSSKREVGGAAIGRGAASPPRPAPHQRVADRELRGGRAGVRATNACARASAPAVSPLSISPRISADLVGRVARRVRAPPRRARRPTSSDANGRGARRRRLRCAIEEARRARRGRRSARTRGPTSAQRIAVGIGAQRDRAQHVERAARRRPSAAAPAPSRRRAVMFIGCVPTSSRQLRDRLFDSRRAGSRARRRAAACRARRRARRRCAGAGGGRDRYRPARAASTAWRYSACGLPGFAASARRVAASISR